MCENSDPVQCPNTNNSKASTTTSMVPLPSEESWHYVVIGDPLRDGDWGPKKGVECRPDAAITSTARNDHGDSLAVTCCSSDSRSYRPGCVSGKTFWAAEALCLSQGLRLCTKSEILKGRGKGSGCWFDAFSSWVSDECGNGSLDNTDNADPPRSDFAPTMPYVQEASNMPEHVAGAVASTRTDAGTTVEK